MTKPNSVLITGVTGFVGSHLVDYIRKTYPSIANVYGTRRLRSPLHNLEHLSAGDMPILVECDLRDPVEVYLVLRDTKPDWIFHLAAQSFVPTSWRQPTETMSTNVISTINIFEALRKLGREKTTKIQIAGSSEEYGKVEPDEIPIRETNPLRPLSPYAVSKVAQDLLGYQYAKSYGMNIVRTRAFNHEGPRRGEVFVTSNFAKQIAEIEAGRRQPEIHVGDLSSKRDFTDVRDVVRAYWMLMEYDARGFGEVFNICSGKAVSMRDMLDQLLALSPVPKVDIIKDADRMRPSDVPILEGSRDELFTGTGWEPKISLAQTLGDTLDYWRGRLKP